MIYQFLVMEAKNYKFSMFCQQCHPSVAPDDGNIQPRNAPRFTPAIYLRRNFVYISNLENRGDKFVDQNFKNIVLDGYANFREKLSRALTARPQKPKLSWILKQIFQDGSHPTYTWMLGGKHTGESGSFWYVQYFLI